MVSAEFTHPALVSDQDFLTVQQITAVALPEDGRARRYALTGLLICGVCGRRLEGHWPTQKPGYRCRHGHTSARPPAVEAPRWVYWSQARLIRQLLAARPEVAEFGDAEALASYLRARDAVIVCGTGTLTIGGSNPRRPGPSRGDPWATRVAAAVRKRSPARPDNDTEPEGPNSGPTPERYGLI